MDELIDTFCDAIEAQSVAIQNLMQAIQNYDSYLKAQIKALESELYEGN